MFMMSLGVGCLAMMEYCTSGIVVAEVYFDRIFLSHVADTTFP